MNKLNQSQPYFIRCFKPNNIQIKNHFDANLMYEQLYYSGIQSVVELRQKGFPYHLSHLKFYSRYKILSINTNELQIMNQSKNGNDHRDILQQFFKRIEMLYNLDDMLQVDKNEPKEPGQEEAGQEEQVEDQNDDEDEHEIPPPLPSLPAPNTKEYAIGKTKVLLKKSIYDTLEQLRLKKIHNCIARVINYKKMKYHQSRLATLIELRNNVVEAMKTNDPNTLEKHITKALSYGLHNFQIKQASTLMNTLNQQSIIQIQIKALLHTTDDFDINQAELLYQQVTELNLNTPITQKLYKRIQSIQLAHDISRALTAEDFQQIKHILNDIAVNQFDINLKQDKSLYPELYQQQRIYHRITLSDDIEKQLTIAYEHNKRSELKLAIQTAQDLELTASTSYQQVLHLYQHIHQTSINSLKQALLDQNLELLKKVVIEEETLLANEDDQNSFIMLNQAKEMILTIEKINKKIQICLENYQIDQLLTLVNECLIKNFTSDMITSLKQQVIHLFISAIKTAIELNETTSLKSLLSSNHYIVCNKLALTNDDKQWIKQAYEIIHQYDNQQDLLSSLTQALEQFNAIQVENLLSQIKANGVKPKSSSSSSSDMVMIVNQAEKYLNDLQQINHDLKISIDTNDLDLLNDTIDLAKALHYDKSNRLWKQAIIVQTELLELHESLSQALHSCDLTAIENALQDADDLSLAKHTRIYVKLQNFIKKVNRLNKKLLIAVKARNFEDLENTLQRLEQLKQVNTASYIDGKNLYQRLLPVDLELKRCLGLFLKEEQQQEDEVTADDHDDEVELQDDLQDDLKESFRGETIKTTTNPKELLDHALEKAKALNCIMKSYNQAKFHAEQEALNQLDVATKDIKSKRYSIISRTSSKQQMNIALQRLKRMSYSNTNNILYQEATDLYQQVNQEDVLFDKLTTAYGLKDEEVLRDTIQEITAQNLQAIAPYINDAKKYLRRFSYSSNDNVTEVRYPLEYSIKTGILLKASNFPYNWKTRHFLLKGMQVEYYDKAPDFIDQDHKKEKPTTSHNKHKKMKPKGSIEFTTVKKVIIDKSNPYGIHLINPNRTLIINARTLIDQNDWYKHLQHNIRVYKRIKRLHKLYDIVCGKEQLNSIKQLELLAKLVYVPDQKEFQTIIEHIPPSIFINHHEIDQKQAITISAEQVKDIIIDIKTKEIKKIQLDQVKKGMIPANHSASLKKVNKYQIKQEIMMIWKQYFFYFLCDYKDKTSHIIDAISTLYTPNNQYVNDHFINFFKPFLSKINGLEFDTLLTALTSHQNNATSLVALLNIYDCYHNTRDMAQANLDPRNTDIDLLLNNK